MYLMCSCYTLIQLFIFQSLFVIEAIKTTQKFRLVGTGNQTMMLPKETGQDYSDNQDASNDYANNVPWLKKCSLKKAGEKTQEDVLGCGGRIKIKCKGGCIKIHKILYSCSMDGQAHDQLDLVKSLCEGRESCNVRPSRKLFGEEECPGSEDSKMIMWTIYSCDGGKDETILENPDKCRGGGGNSCLVSSRGQCKPCYSCTKESSCRSTGGRCR
jgi:hypothetical protein